MNKSMSSFKCKTSRSNLLFSIPAILIYTVFFMYPAISSILYAFTNWDGISTKFRFVLFDNFIRMAQAPELKAGITNTIIYSILNVLFVNVLAILLAAIIQSLAGLKNFFKTAFFVPVMLSSVVVSYVWSSMYRYSDGVINTFFRLTGLDYLCQDWLGDQKFSILSVAFTLIWSAIGLYLIIYTTGIENIPSELYEAADIDGANPVRKFCMVTFPMLAPVFTVCVVLSTVAGLKIFDQPYLMTKGGPGYATESITTMVITEAFQKSDFGLACAYSFVLFIIIACISLIQTNILRKREVSL